MPDGWEVGYGFDPLTKDGLDDQDGDGVMNYIEYMRGTDPLDNTFYPVFKTIYVDDNNTSGPWDGTQTYPYNTIQAGINASEAGDTVSVAGGTYSETQIIIDTPISMEGPSDQSAVLAGFFLAVVDVHWGVLSGFDINTATFLQILNSSDILIRNNIIRVQFTQGIVIGNSSDIVLLNNLIINNAAGGVLIQNGSSATLINNTITGNVEGVNVEAGSQVTIKNCIVWGNGDDLVGITNPSWVSYSDIGDGDFAGQNGNFSADPLFVDPANGDYHLQAGSPCIDAGEFSAEIGFYGTPVSAADGDVNENGVVDTIDVLLSMRISIGAIIPTSAQLAHGDVAPAGSPDGVIDTVDVLLIMKMALGL